ncbi:hypothetical protein SAMN02746041_00467 [Desulfacinum hydrothermale DSM 13146]|uniref:Uncharacterized protein n=1 Tax=Desulfacinum hydrothermale DSM 13146 TaxID=1121390 RepID=A0A1W1X2J9_9BACT|nr:hypothetical protein [Desulfacinum hydrothermale]SMC18127.1 hypothetical protein SAMN02746041_00467 [Desulfacinum hydrothermale DSM 13146]
MEHTEDSARIELLKIQNNRKPEQVISLVREPNAGGLHTEGLTKLFNVQEIWIDTRNIADALNEYARVLSFLMETMSQSEDLALPYGFQDEFTFDGVRYSLKSEGPYRVLRRVPETGQMVYDK